jgi:branched-chain amino acid transport system substrate-binding protein
MTATSEQNAAAASPAAPGPARARPIRLGWLASVSGIFAVNSQAQEWGFRMAVQDINEQGGVLGRMLEPVTRDTESNPARAAALAQELVSSQDIDALCGPLNSGETAAAIPIVAAAGKLHVLGGTVEALIDPVKYPLAFRNINTNGQWMKVAVRTMVQDMRLPKVAVVNDSTAYGTAAMAAVTGMLAQAGLEPAYAATLDPTRPDVAAEIAAARAAGAEALTVWSNATGFLAAVLNARGALAWDVPVVAHPAILQKQVLGLLAKPSYWDRVLGIGYRHAIVDANGRLPAAVEAFIDRHKDAIGPYMQTGLPAFLQGHAAALIFAAGAGKAGTTDPVAVARALESIQVIATPYGPFSYTATDHNGFRDDAMVPVEASRLMANGGYPQAVL